VVGDLDPATTLKLIEQHYGGIPAASVPALAPESDPPRRAPVREAWKKPVAADRGLMAWPAPSQRDPDWLPLSLALEVLVGGPSARLHRRLVVEEEKASSVGGFLMPVRWQGAVELSISMMRNHAFAEAEQVVSEELEKLRREPISAEELEKGVNRYESAFWHELETADGKAEALGHYETVLGDFRALTAAAERVPKVTAEDVRRAAARWLDDQQRVTVVAEPSGEDEGDDEEGAAE
jgi:zinc protease